MSHTFPFWPTVGRSLALTFKHAGLLLRLSWAWLLITAPLLFAFEYIFATYWTSDVDVPVWETIGVFFYWFLQTVVLLPMLSSIAVGWHRYLLRGETPPRGPYLRCDRLVLNYGIVGSVFSCGYFVLMFGGAALAALPAVSMVAMANPLLSVAAAVAAFCAFAYVSTRLFTILPHFALGLPRQQALDGWRASYGRFWRLFLGGCLVVFVSMFVAVFLSAPALLLPWPDGVLANTAATTLQALLYSFLIALPGVTFLSLTYQALVEGSDRASRAS